MTNNKKINLDSVIYLAVIFLDHEIVKKKDARLKY
tara:strand:+ start:2199 stop:2303 length:105 start_codon:yes stop_codon:yes gene_type:complete